ncbi:MAG: acyl-CoA thioesterase, partial [Nitrospinota bacterium]
VRYAETDQMGVVHHAVYYVWFEHLRTEYFRALGMPYSELEAQGIYLPVVESGCRHRGAARYDQRVKVTGRIAAVEGARVRIDYTVEVDGKVVAEGFTIHARVDRLGRPRRLPPFLGEKLRGLGPGG